MAIPRVFVRRARLVDQSLKATRSTMRTRSWQRFQRRTYASDGNHGHTEAGSDLPWAIGAFLFTAPSVWYLWPPSKKGHGDAHGDGRGDGHGHDEHKGHKGGETPVDESGDQRSGGEEADENGETEQGEEEDKSNGSESEGEGSQDTPETSDNESDHAPQEKDGGEDVEGVRFKGPTEKGAEELDTRKSIPDAKGGNKKRIESNYGIRQGAADDDKAAVEEPDHVQDKPAASKPAGSINTQSGKQEGLSNTDTKHSTDITNDPETSKKGEGTPETSKSKGTVDPARPQV